MKMEKIWYPDYYQDGVEEDIVKLTQDDIKMRGSKAIFNLTFWQWKYKNNNAGFHKNWILIARANQDNRVGGHYTAIPVYISCNKKSILSAQSVDTLTHVDFRKQGVFTELAKQCYVQLTNDGVDFIYGYPNDNSYPGFVKKLKWDHIFTVEELVFILNAKKITELKFRNMLLRFFINIGVNTFFAFRKNINSSRNKNFNISAINIENVNAKLIDDWLSSGYGYYIDRSPAYLKWRYDENPIDKDIKIFEIKLADKVVGYYILKLKDYPHRKNLRVAHIMELLFDPENPGIFKMIVNDIINKSLESGADIVHGYSHKAQSDYSMYRKYGFIKYDNKNYIIRMNQNKDLYPGIQEPGKWYISLGDSDRA